MEGDDQVEMYVRFECKHTVILILYTLTLQLNIFINHGTLVTDSLGGWWPSAGQKLLTAFDCRTGLGKQSITGFHMFKEHLI